MVIDEVTARRWMRAHELCPVCSQEREEFALVMDLVRPVVGSPYLACPVHGAMFDVEVVRAA